MRRLIVIGTRGSQLALIQANIAKDKLDSLGFISELKIIDSKDNRSQNPNFDKNVGEVVPTKEIEDALLAKKIDMAVHPLKNLSITSSEGLITAGLSEREDPADVLIIKRAAVDEDQILNLKLNAIVGTPSTRISAQLKTIIPNVQIGNLSGNVLSRIEQFRNGEHDAIIISMSDINGLQINLEEFKVVHLHPKEFIPAPGQGVIGYQCRKDDLEMRKIISKIHNKSVTDASNVERKVAQLIGGDCQLSLGVYCEKDQADNYHVYAAYVMPGSNNLKRAYLSQSTTFQLSERILDQLLN